jgi:hypothetical protein
MAARRPCGGAASASRGEKSDEASSDVSPHANREWIGEARGGVKGRLLFAQIAFR